GERLLIIVDAGHHFHLRAVRLERNLDREKQAQFVRQNRRREGIDDLNDVAVFVAVDVIDQRDAVEIGDAVLSSEIFEQGLVVDLYFDRFTGVIGGEAGGLEFDLKQILRGGRNGAEQRGGE